MTSNKDHISNGHYNKNKTCNMKILVQPLWQMKAQDKKHMGILNCTAKNMNLPRLGLEHNQQMALRHKQTTKHLNYDVGSDNVSCLRGVHGIYSTRCVMLRRSVKVQSTPETPYLDPTKQLGLEWAERNRVPTQGFYFILVVAKWPNILQTELIIVLIN